MTLMEELKERWKAIFLERESVEKRADELAENMQELEVALAALQSLHNPIADEQPELFDEPQEIEASSQSESCVPALGAETDLQTSPGEAEESRDQLCSVEGCEIHADDASEFAEEGYAHVVEPEPPAMEGVAFVDGKWTIPGPSFEELDDDGLEPGPVDEASHPMASYVPATDPKADALAKAADYYSPENVAERNRFDPFRMFKRETEET